MTQMLLQNRVFGDIFAMFLVLATKAVPRTPDVRPVTKNLLKYPVHVLSITLLGVTASDNGPKQSWC